MPNYITNQIELIGSSEDVANLVNEFSTFYPRTPCKSHDGNLVYKKVGSDYSYGWLNTETNEFTTRNEPTVVGIPDGYEQDFDEEWTRFPDFAKIVIPPNDDAYNDKPNQEEAKKSPNWWYNWNVKHWGTKWNSSQCKKKSENTFQFETAWRGVPDLIRIISVRHPNVTIVYKYSDEDTGYNCGVGAFKNGEHDFKQLEGGSVESYNLCFELKPDVKENYKLSEQGKYVYVED